MPARVNDGYLIRKAAGECLKRVPLNQRIRLLGVRVSGLAPAVGEELDMASVQSELPF
jgi:DNA polymerase-4